MERCPVDLLTHALGQEFALVGRLAGGETGATEVRDPGGTRFVLKAELDPDNQLQRREGVRLAELLRTTAGWPCPRQQAFEVDGCLLVLQEHMPGEPVEYLTDGIVQAVVDMVDRARGRGAATRQRWTDDLVKILVDGGNGYCMHQPLRDHDGRTRELVSRIEDIGRSVVPSDLAGSDLVHADLHPGNLLQAAHALTAVVDMDYAQVGDADFDLATFALSGLEVPADPGVHERLVSVGIDQLPEAKRRAYLAALLLRFLDWPIRRGRPQEVEFWLEQADRFLPRC
jgi:hypothetical protein